VGDERLITVEQYAEQLQPKNIYGFLSGRRMEDPRVQIIDAYLQILDERAKT